MKKTNEQWTTVIKPRYSLWEVNVREWWQYRDLIWLLVKRNFVVLYKQTILGPAWAIIQPLLTTLIFTVVFGNIANLPTDDMPPFLFYMCGNVAWTYFQSCLTGTSQTFIGNAKVFEKVYFPRMVMPISTVLTNMITFFIQFALFLVLMVYFLLAPGSVIHPNPGLILLTIPALVQMAVLGLGFGIIISALTTKYRDLQMLVSFGVQLWMYATPVAYASSMIPEQYYFVYMLNPMSPIIELFRSAYLGVNSFEPVTYCISVMTTLVVLVVGILLFNKIEKNFIDTV